MKNLSKLQVLPRNVLKWIAMLAMLCDHIGYVFTRPGSVSYMILRFYIGRLAFPIFAVLFAEGIVRTRRPWRHVLDVFVLALLSECFFDRAFCLQWVFWEYQNVFWTLLLSALVLITLRMLFPVETGLVYRERNQKSVIAAIIFGCFIASAMAYVANILHTDYGAFGVLGICGVGIAFMFWQKIPLWVLTLVFAVGEYLVYGHLGVFLAVPLMMLYKSNAPKVRISEWRRYVYYGFYPVHLACLCLIRVLLK